MMVMIIMMVVTELVDVDGGDANGNGVCENNEVVNCTADQYLDNGECIAVSTCPVGQGAVSTATATSTATASTYATVTAPSTGSSSSGTSSTPSSSGGGSFAGSLPSFSIESNLNLFLYLYFSKLEKICF